MSFGSIAENYDELRPQAPQQAVDWLVPTGCEVAVDVGAGTGLFTRTLVGRAGQVIAVEPDERMRTVLTARSPGVHVVEGRGESIPLPDAAADAVFVSSAWHWMDPERAVPEIGRVLRDGGRFGLIWTSRDREVDWVRNLDRLPGGDRVDAQLADRFRQRLYFDLPEPQIFDNVAREVFRFVRTMTVGDAVAMLGTYSRAIIASSDDRTQALAEARTALEERFPGADTVDIPMRAWCWRADRIAPLAGGNRDSGRPQFEGCQRPNGDGILAAPAANRVRADGRQFARRPIRQCPQRQQLLAGRGGRQCGHHPFAPEEPEPQEQPRHDRYEDRRRGDGHRQQHREPARRGVQVMAGAGDVQGGLAGRGQRLADRIAQQRNVLCAMARRRQVVGNPLRAAFHLSAGVGDRRDGAVHSETDEHPYHRPHGDGDIAHQLGEQSQRFGGVRHEPHGTDTSTLCD